MEKQQVKQIIFEKEYKNKSLVKPVPGIITMGNTELVLTLLTT